LGERELLAQTSLFGFQPELAELVVFSIKSPELPLVNPDGVVADCASILVGVTVPKIIPVGASMAV